MPFPTVVAEGRWSVHERLGEGNFGVVHRASCNKTHQEVAVKFEENTRRRAPNQLELEVKLIQKLRDAKQVPQGVMNVFHFGSDSQTRCNFAVLELLGKSLDRYLTAAGDKLSLATTVLIAEQCVQRLEYLHSRGIIHRDVKPDNMMMGTGKKAHHLYLVDYGLSQAYFDSEHCPMITGVSLVGNARYASLNAHAGIQQSRRDDLEALGYVLLQFLLGKLPWTGLAARTVDEKYKKIHQKKASTAIDDLCAGLPGNFAVYLAACRELEFAERPNYCYLRELFTEVRLQIGKGCSTPLCDQDLEWREHNVADVDLELLEVHDYTQPDDADTKTSGSAPSLSLQLRMSGA